MEDNLIDMDAAYEWLLDNAHVYTDEGGCVYEDELFEALCAHLGLDAEDPAVDDAFFPLVARYMEGHH